MAMPAERELTLTMALGSVKHKGGKWKPRRIVLKGPGLSVFKQVPVRPIGTPPLKLKFGVDLGRSDSTSLDTPAKYVEQGLHVLVLKPGKGVSRILLQLPNLDAIVRWRTAVDVAMQRAKAAAAVLVTIPRAWQIGTPLHVRLPSGRSRQVQLPATVRVGAKLCVRFYGGPHTICDGEREAVNDVQLDARLSTVMQVTGVASLAELQRRQAQVVEIAQCSQEEAAAELMAGGSRASS